MSIPTFTAEQIEDEVKATLQLFAGDDAVATLADIIEQQRAEIEQLRAENARLIEENAQRAVCHICRQGDPQCPCAMK